MLEKREKNIFCLSFFCITFRSRPKHQNLTFFWQDASDGHGTNSVTTAISEKVWIILGRGISGYFLASVFVHTLLSSLTVALVVQHVTLKHAVIQDEGSNPGKSHNLVNFTQQIVVVLGSGNRLLVCREV